MALKIISFYKYTEIENPEKFRDEHQSLCENLSLKGKIYIAFEGINGNVCGEEENINQYKNKLSSLKGFENIIFKEDEISDYVFPKMHVRVKKELVNLSIEELTNEKGGERLSPEKLLEFYETGKDFIVIDTRNSYESKIGHFKNALQPEMKNFREWPIVVETLSEYKDKTIVTYCTGGIRCEKASAYLIKKGFKNVYQLDGGILTYIKKYPDTFWHGGMFVFDGRKVVEPNTKDELKHTANCELCGNPTSYYINCHNLDCDKLIVCCKNCTTKYNYCCSQKCDESDRKRERIYV